MYAITRKYSFSAAHRIEGHPKCGRLHGHNYEVTVEVRSKSLPSDGMLIDYGELDKIVKPLIDQMDHRYIVSASNHRNRDPYETIALDRGEVFPLNMPSSTAENLAEFLHHEILYALRDANYSVTREQLVIYVSETAKSTAVFIYDF